MDNTDSNNSSNQKPQQFMDFVRPTSVNPLTPKAPTKSSTLMRSVVNKPTDDYRRQMVGQAPVSVPAQPEPSSVVTKSSYQSVDTDREARASLSPKSELFSRFGSQATAASSAPEPVTTPVASVAAQPLDSQPAVPEQHSPSMDIFEKSLSQASAANQPPLNENPQKSSGSGKKLTTIAALCLAVLVAAAIFGYQNINRVNLYLASSKAGFSATTPHYSPSGYGLASVSYGSGVIKASYHSTTDNRTYSVNEKSSNWDSKTLLNSYVQGVAGQNYETIQSNGRTIYLYGSRDATWVYNGIWYIVTSNSSLSDQQLIQLATSM